VWLDQETVAQAAAFERLQSAIEALCEEQKLTA
jgi:hypothetical protein